MNFIKRLIIAMLSGRFERPRPGARTTASTTAAAAAGDHSEVQQPIHAKVGPNQIDTYVI